MFSKCPESPAEKLKPEVKAGLVRELVSFLEEECDIQLSEFRGEMIVDLVAEGIAAEVYNGAILDARAFLSERLEDMEATLYAHRKPLNS